MKIIIEPGDMEEPEVIIRGRSGSEEVRQLLELLGGAGGISQIPLYAEEKEYFFRPEEISYFLTEGGKVSAYLESGVYEAKGRLYELARVYLPGREDGLANESKVLTLGAYGEDMDFYAMKGAVEAILKDIRAVDIHFEGPTGAPSAASYHPGRCARILVDGREVGVFGQIHPLVAQNYGVDAELYCAELSFDALCAAKGADPQYVPLPKFPAVTRDIAVVCGEEVTVGALEAAIKEGAHGLLKEVKLFDIYRGKGVAEGKKSVAFNLVLRADDRSLTAEEADNDVKAILATLEAKCGAVLR